MKHLPIFSRMRGRRIANGRTLVACAASFVVLLSASNAMAQYSGLNPQSSRRTAHYGNPSTIGTTQSLARSSNGSSTLFPRGASFYDPADAVDPAPMPSPSEGSQESITDQIWSNGGCADGSCSSCDTGCNPCGCLSWYVGVTGLIMTRDMPNRIWTSFETGNNPNQLTNTQDVAADWEGGAEIVLGYCLPCYCGWSIEGRYWQLDDFNGYASTTHASGVSTPLDTSGIEFGGTNGDTFFDGADEHRLWRNNEFYNIEFNMVKNSPHCRGCLDCGWHVGGLVGFRYMRFDEDLRFGTLAAGGSWATPTDQAYLEDNIRNELYGFQVGANVRRQFANNLAFTFTPKVGIFGNHIDNRFHAYRGDGLAANPTAASGVTGTYPVNGSSDTLSFMLEADLGLAWQITNRWEATFGYRVVALTGMGLADNQIAPFVVDIPELADIDTNGQLVLHGGYVGMTYRF